MGQFVVTIALIRLLAPAEFGRVALVYVVAGLVAVLDDGGFTTALIARDERDQDTLSTIFYQEVLLGSGLSALVAAGAPLLAAAFGQPELRGYVLALAPAFALTGPRRFYQTIFQRDFAFEAMAWSRVTAAVLFVAVTVGMALKGYGVWALVAGLIVRVGVESVLFAVVGWGRFRPGRPTLRRWRTGYGSPGLMKVAERFVSYLGERVDVVVIGLALGTADLGIYDACKRLLLGVYQQVVPWMMRLAVVEFAREAATPSSKGLWRVYEAQLSRLTATLLPAYGFAAVIGFTLLPALGGEEWTGYGGVFAYLALGLALRAYTAPTDALFVGLGRMDKSLLLTSISIVLVTTVLLYSLPLGLEAVARATAGALGLVSVCGFLMAARQMGIAYPSRLALLLLGPLVALLFAMVATTQLLGADLPDGWRLLLVAAIFCGEAAVAVGWLSWVRRRA